MSTMQTAAQESGQQLRRASARMRAAKLLTARVSDDPMIAATCAIARSTVAAEARGRHSEAAESSDEGARAAPWLMLSAVRGATAK
eukprot:4922827-Pleurochrysis_carterae.AAC.1